jgi:hypothetical protein
LLSDAEVYILENTLPLEGEEYQLISLGGKYMKKGENVEETVRKGEENLKKGERKRGKGKINSK